MGCGKSKPADVATDNTVTKTKSSKVNEAIIEKAANILKNSENAKAIAKDASGGVVDAKESNVANVDDVKESENRNGDTGPQGDNVIRGNEKENDGSRNVEKEKESEIVVAVEKIEVKEENATEGKDEGAVMKSTTESAGKEETETQKEENASESQEETTKTEEKQEVEEKASEGKDEEQVTKTTTESAGEAKEEQTETKKEESANESREETKWTGETVAVENVIDDGLSGSSDYQTPHAIKEAASGENLKVIHAENQEEPVQESKPETNQNSENVNTVDQTMLESKDAVDEDPTKNAESIVEKAVDEDPEKNGEPIVEAKN